VTNDVRDAERGKRQKPNDHDRPEQRADASRAVPLDREQADQDDDRDRHDELVELRRGDLETFDGREHADGRGDHAVAVDQGRAEHAEQSDRGSSSRRLERRAGERHERQGAAFALVVRAQDVEQVLDRDDQHQRPDHQRQHAVDVVRGRRHAVRRVEALAERVKRARPDVAVDDTQRTEGERREVRMIVTMGSVVVMALGFGHDDTLGADDRARGGDGGR
jgi:hypothetical protein